MQISMLCEFNCPYRYIWLKFAGFIEDFIRMAMQLSILFNLLSLIHMPIFCRIKHLSYTSNHADGNIYSSDYLNNRIALGKKKTHERSLFVKIFPSYMTFILHCGHKWNKAEVSNTLQCHALQIIHWAIWCSHVVLNGWLDFQFSLKVPLNNSHVPFHNDFDTK